ncbi:hypothetical protein [Ensifer sp. LCM 4579]|uniref:hypothetical protein n=1 Tax=Ensifer sp. LCM 4579 TaxID=1848292 RepID=UPI001920BE88|nr:hypothetical protein [Ensifer sp. LCM 4579]
MAELANRKPVILAETYPGDVYRQIGIPRSGWSKRRQADRTRMGQSILPWLAARPNLDTGLLQPFIDDGFGSDKSGEDRFDAVVGLLGMLDVVDRRRGEGIPAIDAIQKWEGWILGHHRDDVT